MFRGSIYRQPGVTCWVIYTSVCWHWALCQGSWSPCWVKYIPIILSLAWCSQEKRLLQSEISSKIKSFCEIWITTKVLIDEEIIQDPRKSVSVLLYFSLSWTFPSASFQTLAQIGWSSSSGQREEDWISLGRVWTLKHIYDQWIRIFYVFFAECGYYLYIKGQVQSSILFVDLN